MLNANQKLLLCCLLHKNLGFKTHHDVSIGDLIITLFKGDLNDLVDQGFIQSIKGSQFFLTEEGKHLARELVRTWAGEKELEIFCKIELDLLA